LRLFLAPSALILLFPSRPTHLSQKKHDISAIDLPDIRPVSLLILPSNQQCYPI
jgi:hypothetical protein